jgi:restriction system protein
MAIPDFQTLMRPLLESIRDGREHTVPENRDAIAKSFKLSEADQQVLLPSGRQTIFANRLAWAKTHLRMAGLVENTSRGAFRITTRGEKVLHEVKGPINLRVLQSQPGYAEARDGDHKKDAISPQSSKPDESQTQTPDEIIEQSYQGLRKSLARELISRLKTASPSFFERTVVELLVRMGYGGNRADAGKAIGRTGDEGIDGMIKEDRLGLDTIYIQAKRWDKTVGRPQIQEFAGALQGFRAKKGIFLTTSDFSREALDYANRIDSRIVLIDGEALANYMIDFGVGVSGFASYELKRIDSEFFNEESV